MVDYYSLQEELYRELIERHKKTGLTFSVRRKFGEGAKNNIFLGTEKSKYFAFSLWDIALSYPGASIDLITYILRFQKDGYEVQLQCHQTNDPKDDQNKINLKLIKDLEPILEETAKANNYGFKRRGTDTKMYTFRLFKKIEKEEQILNVLFDLIDSTYPIINNKIDEYKSQNPNWDADKIPIEKFNSWIKKLDDRRSDKPADVLNEESITYNLITEQNPTEVEPKNIILYGPPGTGKTYNTINRAIELANPQFDIKQERSIVQEEFKRLKKEGEITFTTFHQSMSYEDFVEGIKPLKPEEKDTYLKYDIEPGIFKLICNRARKIHFQKVDVDWESAKFYKMSLGGKERSDIHDWCIDNNYISLWWGSENDLSKYKPLVGSWEKFRNQFKKDNQELVDESRFHMQAAFIFLKIKINDIVIVSRGNFIIDAIGIVKGEYEWHDEFPFEFYHYRKVEWLAKDMAVSPDRFLKKSITQMSIYNIDKQFVKTEELKEYTSKSTNKIPEKPHVLIIDEINRGNVSQIFGELITLIEPDKRQGMAEALELTLPYSKEKFSVPSNLHIIGTMNTADRSVEALDTALRRRFEFEEMMPQPELIKEKGKSNGFVYRNNSGEEKDKIDLVDLLKTINERIEVLVDRDHTIGHSYFMNVTSVKDLKEAFHNKIIPLLQEYFYGDYQKMEMVIGSGFLESKSRNIKFAKSAGDIDTEGFRYSIKNVAKFTDDEFYKAIDILLGKTPKKVDVTNQESN